MRARVHCFDLMRCVAALAVVTIHVLGPYRHLYGTIAMNEWGTAVVVNSFLRWAVPVFILISGALMLSDERPFNFHYYVKRRLGKVLLPFLVWSAFYAYLSGWSADGFDSTKMQEVIKNSYQHGTYYHLGFFYYFIPLYFVIPLFQYAVKNVAEKWLYAFVAIWLITTFLFLFHIHGPWYNQYWLYSGYLPLGYLLYKKLPLDRPTLVVFAILGVLSLVMTAIMVISHSIALGHYSVGHWLSYKTINVVLAASMVFVCCRYWGETLSARSQRVVSFISKHSLGVYLLHPLFLWPMKAFGWYQGHHPLYFIPLWVVISGSCALLLSTLLSLSAKTRWLVP